MTAIHDEPDAVPIGPGGRPDRAEYGPVTLSDWLGLHRWQFDHARTAGLLPDPDLGSGNWSHTAALTIAHRLPQIVADVGADPPIGARRSAERLEQRTGLQVAACDVDTIFERGLLTSAGTYKGFPLYSPAALDAVHGEVVADVVAERIDWCQRSLPAEEAAAVLGWQLEELEQVAAARGITPGRLGRYTHAEIDELGADSDLCEQVRRARLLGPDQAAAHLAIRRTDWDYVVAAGWIAPKTVISKRVSRYSSVRVPLYATGDVESLLEVPGVDWEEVRAVQRGRPSPLRDFARIPPTRAQVVRSWVAELGHKFGVEVWAWYAGGPGVWTVDWELLPDGTPTLDQVQRELAAHPPIAAYAADVKLCCDAGVAIRWARQMLQPGAAVILDTETTDLDGVVIEVAVIDACTGKTLLDTLVDPAGTPIAPGAYAVHGISEASLAGAPAWKSVLPKLRRVTKGRQILAYNADFDLGVIARTTHRAGLRLGSLADESRWGCIMDRRSDWARVNRWLPLGGGHRALGDCHSAREVLQAMTAP